MYLVALIAVVALVVFWVRKRKQRANEILNLTLAVVGFEASGKTVFIGSMFNELRVPDASGVFLDTSPENAGSWPLSTTRRRTPIRSSRIRPARAN